MPDTPRPPDAILLARKAQIDPRNPSDIYQHSNSKLGREYGVDPKQVRRWREEARARSESAAPDLLVELPPMRPHIPLTEVAATPGAPGVPPYLLRPAPAATPPAAPSPAPRPAPAPPIPSVAQLQRELILSPPPPARPTNLQALSGGDTVRARPGGAARVWAVLSGLLTRYLDHRARREDVDPGLWPAIHAILIAIICLLLIALLTQGHTLRFQP